MQNIANSGWLYQIGDVIFGDVLTINCDNLSDVLNVYSKSIYKISEATFNIKNNVFSKISNKKYDCIIVNAVDNGNENPEFIEYLNSYLKINGIIAVVEINDTNFKNVFTYKYFYNVLRKVINSSEGDNFDGYYMQSIYGKINQVFYSSGYKSVKNPFLLKEKLRQIYLNKYLYPLFSSLVLKIYNTSNFKHKTVLENIINNINSDLNSDIIFKSVTKYLVIPYKVLATVKDIENNEYIFLLLRGADKNVRANIELEMINYLNAEYPMLSKYLSKSIISGIYKNVEYIIYKKIPGVSIDSYFTDYNIAERAAFDMLVSIGEMSAQSNQDNVLNNTTKKWFNSLKSYENANPEYSNYLDTLFESLTKEVNENICDLVLFHGDYKIENLIYDPLNYEVNGIIDWDLSEKQHLPGLDLLYLIFYTRRIKNSTSFISECENVFLKEGFSDNEQALLDEYFIKFDISMNMFRVIKLFFILHHFSCRERTGYEVAWLTDLFNKIWNVN
ncbi:MAG: hypothetical protein DIZ80_06470 [endosymbiont of Galathealinum brachiosum]|uniref:Aminoglycoside phosphotransferase domain-containing protein n=1 Tax=endosymbiont of Galathealinum brachiosum TaxID=2200906 RepID=A0A370DFT1_9GAMM|nr:MAG: hypothetical protein DIZ80_06470 [endosymbiont of Galathealinum brachiosum]